MTSRGVSLWSMHKCYIQADTYGKQLRANITCNKTVWFAPPPPAEATEQLEYRSTEFSSARRPCKFHQPMRQAHVTPSI